MEVLTDEENIKLMLSIEGIANYGTYDAKNLATFFHGQLNRKDIDEGALLRLGLVDVQYVSLPVNNKDVIKELYALNKRWRNLRKFNDYAVFIEWERQEAIAETEKIQTERAFIKSQNQFLEINKTVAEKQLELITNQIGTNKNIEATNTNITATNRILKIIFGLTAAIYLLQLLAMLGLLPSKGADEKTHIQQQDSIIRTQGILLNQKANQEIYNKREIDSLKNVLKISRNKTRAKP